MNQHEEFNEKNTLKAKLKEIEILVYKQKLHLTAKLFNLKEKEVNESRFCRCRGFCRINHEKYSWKKSASAELFCALENLEMYENIKQKETGTLKKIYTCELCEEAFVKIGDLKMHKKTIHKTSTVISA